MVVPGFIDTHVHLHQLYDIWNGVAPEFIDNSYRRRLSETYLHYGITTIVDMGLPEKWIETTLNWQKNPSAEYPNIIINGSSLISDEEREPAQHHVEIPNPEAGRKKVREYVESGITHIKLYSRLRAPEMKAIINEAQKRGIVMNAHVDNNIVTIPQAIDYGVRNFEHFFTVLPSVLVYDEHLDKINEKYGLKGVHNIDELVGWWIFCFAYIGENPDLDTRLHTLFDRMAEEKITISTTIQALAAVAGKSDLFSSFNHYPLRNSPYLPAYSAAQKRKLQSAYETAMHYLKTAYDKGVKIRIGTDNREGGKAFLSELALLHEAGFATEDILQIATLNGAEAMKIESRYGSIETGKQADLVLFHNNPLKDHRNFQGRKTIIKGGKIFVPQKGRKAEVLDTIHKKGISAAIHGFSTLEESPLKEDEWSEVAYQLFLSGEIDDAITLIKFYIKTSPDSGEEYDRLRRSNINFLGYTLLFEGKTKDALKIFQCNAELYPEYWNVYDSLGEAYLAAGNEEMAILNYKKSVELNPENNNAIAVLKELKAK
ncbi:amidohydrolase family protein [Sinomicrobium sp. M5D2P17]